MEGGNLMSSYLSELCRFYDRLSADPESGMPPEGMIAEQISFALVISEDGKLVSVQDLRDGKGRAARFFVPAAVKRASNVASNFLWDNTGYALGVDGKGKPKRTLQTAESFKMLHRKLLASCDDVHAKALLAFLAVWRPEMFEELDEKEALLDSNIIFKLRGHEKWLHEAEALQKIWHSSLKPEREGTDTSVCLITGERGLVAPTHPSIKGVPGAQSSGAALISFNCPAFTSYGKEQNANAPVTENAARAYTSALNYLLRREHRQTVRIGDTSIVYWTDKADPVETMLASLFDLAPASAPPQDQAQLDRLKGILKNLRKGCPLNEADKELNSGARFFILGLAPNAARLSVRFWLTDTLEALLKHLSRWYEDLSIERQYPGSEPEFPPLWLLLLRTVAAQEKSENIPPALGGQMARAVFSGSNLPENAYAAALQRIHADKMVNYFRASFIKAYLCRNKHEEKDMTTLNRDEDNIGYRLGRLFALLEKAQKDALGTVNAPLRERYIGAASATPRLVFPMLLRLNQHHITKAQKGGSEGYEIWFHKIIGEIVGSISAFPAVLSLEDQGRFMLGYYHQVTALYAKKTDTAQPGE